LRSLVQRALRVFRFAILIRVFWAILLLQAGQKSFFFFPDSPLRHMALQPMGEKKKPYSFGATEHRTFLRWEKHAVSVILNCPAIGR
jgi:hypothetical protein